jgi:hypothetical protein
MYRNIFHCNYGAIIIIIIIIIGSYYCYFRLLFFAFVIGLMMSSFLISFIYSHEKNISKILDFRYLAIVFGFNLFVAFYSLFVLFVLGCCSFGLAFLEAFLFFFLFVFFFFFFCLFF